jgi:hypothetical protein
MIVVTLVASPAPRRAPARLDTKRAGPGPKKTRKKLVLQMPTFWYTFSARMICKMDVAKVAAGVEVAQALSGAPSSSVSSKLQFHIPEVILYLLPFGGVTRWIPPQHVSTADTSI